MEAERKGRLFFCRGEDRAVWRAWIWAWEEGKSRDRRMLILKQKVSMLMPLVFQNEMRRGVWIAEIERVT